LFLHGENKAVLILMVENLGPLLVVCKSLIVSLPQAGKQIGGVLSGRSFDLTRRRYAQRSGQAFMT
jgi:hypothetical protein